MNKGQMRAELRKLCAAGWSYRRIGEEYFGSYSKEYARQLVQSLGLKTLHGSRAQAKKKLPRPPRVEPTKKVCTLCGAEKRSGPQGEFSPNGKRKDGSVSYSSRCKHCKSKVNIERGYSKKWRDTNPEKSQEIIKRHWAKRRNEGWTAPKRDGRKYYLRRLERMTTDPEYARYIEAQYRASRERRRIRRALIRQQEELTP